MQTASIKHRSPFPPKIVCVFLASVCRTFFLLPGSRREKWHRMQKWRPHSETHRATFTGFKTENSAEGRSEGKRNLQLFTVLVRVRSEWASGGPLRALSQTSITEIVHKFDK